MGQEICEKNGSDHVYDCDIENSNAVDSFAGFAKNFAEFARHVELHNYKKFGFITGSRSVIKSSGLEGGGRVTGSGSSDCLAVPVHFSACISQHSL